MTATMPHLTSASPQTRPAGILKQQSHDSNDGDDRRHSAVAADIMSPHALLGMKTNPVSPRPTPKSVSILHHADTVSPLMLGQQKGVDEFPFHLTHDVKMPAMRSPRSQRLSRRISYNWTSPSLRPLTPLFTPTADPDDLVDGHASDTQHQPDRYDLLVDQISAWIVEERAKQSRQHQPDEKPDTSHEPSTGPIGTMDLDKLESIVKHNLLGHHSRFLHSARRRPSIRKLRRKPSTTSDSECHDAEILVPSCDVVLDNTKTVASNGGAPESDVSSSDELQHAPSYRDHDAWAGFKFEIVRLTHTLRLKGWRKVPMEMSSEIAVQRLSGALTNAVYVVSPPDHLPDGSATSNGRLSRKPPPKLLLRIYGPQVEHLIDREAELAILQRLARKHIGPRLLGTFANGRFEEYFHARTLTAEDLRKPETSPQIAKRMRELHDGVELLDQERHAGPFVWRNWDKWQHRAEQIVSWMDQQINTLEPGVKPTGNKAWMRRGFICGMPWTAFKDAVTTYRQWLEAQCGGLRQVEDLLVFAHNDTQYGNILRMVPSGDSPLLLPANTHKQLVVIDFEYSSANTRGHEFANHFTEWCYNYHDKRKPYACHAQRYPTPEEQDRFIRTYVRHRPQFNVNTPKLAPMNGSHTPDMSGSSAPEPVRRTTTAISDFMLDRRTPHPSAHTGSNPAEDAAEDAEVARLARETRLWRLANHAMWVAWGVVQAKVPGLPSFDGNHAANPVQGHSPKDPEMPSEPEKHDSPNEPAQQHGDNLVEDDAHALLAERAEEYKTLAERPLPVEDPTHAVEEEQEEFDYLGYAQHRAMFFWGDMVQLGLIALDDLPAEMRGKLKTVPY